MGIAPDDELDNLITIGQEVLRGFKTYYNFKDKKIGFLPKDGANGSKIIGNKLKNLPRE